MSHVKEFVVEYLEREYALPKDVDLDTFNYIDSGYVDSMGFIQFIAMLEDEFEIEFTDDELTEKKYQLAGEMIELVEKKVSEK